MKFVFLAFVFLTTSNVSAQERYRFYQGIRQMAMGGAAVATVNDETSLLLNPAALGKLRDFYITLLDPELEIGAETQEITKYDAFKSRDPQEALDKCKLFPDKHLHGKAQIFPSIVVPNFGVGLLGKYQIDGEMNSVPNKFSYHYVNDWALVFGVNFRFWNGIIKLGTNARITNRTEVHNDEIDPSSTELKLQTLASSGIGVGTDTGFIFTAPVSMLPTLAAVYRDVGGTSYALRDGMFLKKTTAYPVRTVGTLDGALSMSPILSNRIRSTITVEYQDILTADEETDHMRRAHGGLEINFADAFFLRGGMNQRYWTAGLELSMMNYQFQVATYGEDIGVVNAPVEDRRYEVKFAFRF